MTGTSPRRGSGPGLVLQARDRLLLAELPVMRVIDREQAKLVAGFGSTTRANARLLLLTRAGLLHRFFLGTVGAGQKAIYTLSPAGATVVQVPYRRVQRKQNALLAGDQFLAHQIAINEVYLAFRYRPIPLPGVGLRRWRTFPAPLSPAIPLIPDGYGELDTPAGVKPFFLEVDLGTEALKVWQAKVERYVRLAVSGEFTRLFAQPQFRILVLAPSERRLANIRATVAKSTDKLFWFTTFSTIQRDGLWAPVWLRPTGEPRQPLV